MDSRIWRTPAAVAAIRRHPTVGNRLAASGSGRWLCRLLPVAALSAIVVVDVILDQRAWPLEINAPLDWTGHLLTAALLLVVLPRWARGKIWPWALIGSVAIDIDHMPLYTFAPGFEVGGRPPTHSLLTVLILGTVAVVIPAARIPFAGLALGVCLHVVRDVATGPGVPLLWPLHGSTVRVSYAAYLAVLVAAVGVGTWRIFRGTDTAAPHP